MNTKQVCRKRRMKASRQFGAAALREFHASDRIVAYAEREDKVAAKEAARVADRLARSKSQQTEEEG